MMHQTQLAPLNSLDGVPPERNDVEELKAELEALRRANLELEESKESLRVRVNALEHASRGSVEPPSVVPGASPYTSELEVQVDGPRASIETHRARKSSRSSNNSHPKVRALRRTLRLMLESYTCRIVLAISLTLALFLSSFFSLIDVPDGVGPTLLDIIMMMIMIIFALEIVATVIADRTYICSFFFLMDILGTISLIFEISFLLANVDAVQVVVLRTARVARSGVRAIRMLKLLKGVSYVFRTRSLDAGLSAKDLQRKMTNMLATRVAIIAVILMVVLPLFDIPSYPTSDRSMESWVARLEFSYGISAKSNDWLNFSSTVVELNNFYDASNFFPYEMSGFPTPDHVDLLRNLRRSAPPLRQKKYTALRGVVVHGAAARL